MAEIYTLSRGVIKGVQERDVKFNHCQRELLARTYAHFLDDLENSFRKDSTKDDCLRQCAKALTELWRVMTYGEMLVAEWTNEEWWRTVMSSSVSWSLQTHLNFLLQDFLRCVDLTRIAIAEATCNHNFVFPSMSNYQSFAVIVDEAYKRDSHTLLRDIEALKEGKTFLQRKFGTTYGLSKYLLRKFKPETSDPESRRHYILDPHFVEISERCLGTGSFGTVFECKCFGVSAIAKLLSPADEEIVRGVEREAELFSKLQHANLVQFIGYTVQQETQQHVLLTEQGDQNLRTYLTLCRAKHKRPAPVSLLVALDLMLQIAEAMKYLHQREIKHGNLKPSNILVNVTEKKNVSKEHFWSNQVKLADFGLLELKLSTARASIATDQARATPWRAPEAYENISGYAQKYTNAADVYSFAMTMFEILTGVDPFDSFEPMEVQSRLLTGWRPTLPSKDQCPLHLTAYIQRCWSTNPKERPLFPDICKMLSYCKGALLRHSFPSPLSCVNEYDAQTVSSHLGSKWCIQEGAKGNLPLEVYSYAIFDACRSQKLTAEDNSGVDWTAEGMTAGRWFGNWRKHPWHPEKAFKLFIKAAYYNDSEALWRLGMCYELGIGTGKNEAKAIMMYETARDLKFASAFVELGYCHATGHGVPVNFELAKTNWLSALQMQNKTGKNIQCIQELLDYLTRDIRAFLLPGSDAAYKALALRLLELTKFDIGRRLVAGPDSCNAALLQEIANTECPFLQETLEQIVQNLGKEGDLMQCKKTELISPDDDDDRTPQEPSSLAKPCDRLDADMLGKVSVKVVRSTVSFSNFIVIALVCLLAACAIKYFIPWRTASYSCLPQLLFQSLLVLLSLPLQSELIVPVISRQQLHLNFLYIS